MTRRRLDPVPANARIDGYLTKVLQSGYLPNVPLIDIPAVRQAVGVALTPATQVELTKALAVLEASFKWPSTDVIADRQAYVAAMAEELGDYPYVVLIEAIRQARRSHDWIPSIKEMIDLCERLIKPLRTANVRLTDMETAAEEAERQAQERARQREEVGRLFVQNFGVTPTVDFAAVWAAFDMIDGSFLLGRWCRAVRDAQPRAAKFARYMAVVGLGVAPAFTTQITLDQWKQFLDLAETDEPAARRMIDDLRSHFRPVRRDADGHKSRLPWEFKDDLEFVSIRRWQAAIKEEQDEQMPPPRWRKHWAEYQKEARSRHRR
jgi:hypothetical protein